MITLVAGDNRLAVDPATGGAITRFDHAGVPLFRAVADPRLVAQQGRAIAGYPLLPFCNRIAGGRFVWAGATHQLARNFGDDPNTIHGNGWMRRWSVVSEKADHLVLGLEHAPPADPAGEWPFRYRARLDYALEPDALRIGLTLTNTDDRATPAGLGFHPYVARTADMRLGFRAEAVWLPGEDGLPARRCAPPDAAHAFSPARAPGPAVIDACYDGWNRDAVVEWPDRRLALSITADAALGHLQLYTPEARDYIGLEPVSHMPDAINRADVVGNGLRTLAPGEMLASTMRFRLT